MFNDDKLSQINTSTHQLKNPNKNEVVSVEQLTRGNKLLKNLKKASLM